MMGKRIVGLGLTGMDLIAEVDEIPGPDEHAFMRGFEKQAGGIVGNALAAAARLGLEAAWIGKVADDDAGNYIISEVRKENIDTSMVVVEKGARSPFSIVLVDRKTKGRSIIFNRGCSTKYGSEVSDEFLKKYDVIHLDGYFFDAALEAALKAKRLGVKVSLDAGLMFPGLDPLLGIADIFIPTRKIATELTCEKDTERAIRKLADMGPEIVVVTMGKSGCAGLWGDEFVSAPAFKVDAIDTTGAGDTFHGAFIFAYLKGWTFEQMLVFSNAVSALKCTRLGGRKGMPRFDEVADFLDERGFNFCRE